MKGLKKTKKIVSWLTSISIVASLFGSITGYASNEMRETYVIDNYVTGTGIWKANEVNDAAYKATITNEDGAVKYTTAAKNDYAAYENGNAGGIIRKINGDEGIGFDNGQKVVIKTRVKKTGDSALRLAVNRPDDGGNPQEWSRFTNVLAIVDANKFRYPTGFNGNNLSMGNIDLSYYNQTNKWIDITITLDGTNNTADYSFNYEYNAEGKRTTTEKTNISLSRPANCAINADTKIKSISFVTTGGNNANENIYIDYLEVYAIVPDVSEAYINENYNTGTGFWKVNEVKDTAYKATFTNEDGAVKYTTAAKNDYAAYENGNAGGIIRKINGDEGIGFDDGQKVVIKTRVKKTGDSTLRLAVNRPDDGGKAAEWNAFTYVLAAVNATTLRYPIGINGSNSSQLSMTNIDLSYYNQTNKWIDITITLDGTNNTADYSFNYEYNAEGKRTTTEKTNISLSRPANCAINADTKIKSISFVTTGGNNANEDIYIDYLRVYALTDGMFDASLQDSELTDEENVVVLDVNSELDADTVDNVKIIDADNNEVEATVKYGDNAITVIAKELMESGNYTLVTDGVKTIYGEGLSKDSYAFVVRRPVQRTTRMWLENNAGAELENVEKGNVIPKFEFAEDFAKDTVIIASALYKNGQLCEVITEEVSTTEGYAQFTDFDGFVITDEKTEIVKSFVWESLDSIKPLIPVKIFSGISNYLTVYVTEDGNDNNSGLSELESVRTLEKAQSIATVLSQENGEDNIEIVIGEGQYFVEEPISYDNVNSYKDRKIVYTAKGNAKPEIINGVSFKISEAEKVEDEAILNRLSDSSAKDYLYSINLGEKVDAIPNVNLPGFCRKFIPWLKEEYPETTCEMFFNGEAMTIARYPNNGWIDTYTVYDEGALPCYWSDSYIGTDEYVEEAERDQTDGFTIGCSDSRVEKWTNAKDALLYGFWKHGWADQTVPLKGVGKVLKTVESSCPSYYGVGGNPKFYVYNLLEEIDMVGEYYIDRTSKIMYFYMPENATDNDEVIMTVSDKPVFSMNKASNITLKGLKIGPVRTNAIKAADSNKINVIDCEIYGTGKKAIVIDGMNNRVENNYIHDVNGGISASGGDFRNLTPNCTLIFNNEISDFSRIDKTYTPAIDLTGVGTKALNNKIHGSTHCAIQMTGNENEISYNEIYDVLKETDDAGAIYVGRSWIQRGNKITYNYIHDIESLAEQNDTVNGIFVDDNYSGITIFGNVIENVKGNGIKFNGGRDNNVQNNVLINCTNAVQINDTRLGIDANMSALETSYYKTEIWKEKYPTLYNILENNPEMPVGNIYALNLNVKCGSEDIGENYKTYSSIGKNYNIADEPGFSDYENRIYSLKEDSIVFTELNGFINIPFEKIGLKNNTFEG